MRVLFRSDCLKNPDVLEFLKQLAEKLKDKHNYQEVCNEELEQFLKERNIDKIVIFQGTIGEIQEKQEYKDFIGKAAKIFLNIVYYKNKSITIIKKPKKFKDLDTAQIEYAKMKGAKIYTTQMQFYAKAKENGAEVCLLNIIDDFEFGKLEIKKCYNITRVVPSANFGGSGLTIVKPCGENAYKQFIGINNRESHPKKINFYKEKDWGENIEIFFLEKKNGGYIFRIFRFGDFKKIVDPKLLNCKCVFYLNVKKADKLKTDLPTSYKNFIKEGIKHLR